MRRSELESPSPAYKGPDAVSVPEAVGHREHYGNSTPQLREPSLTSGNDEDPRDAVVLSTQSHIEEFLETGGIVNKELLRRCQSAPDLLLRASMLSPRTLLDKGAQTLQRVYRGDLPDTFDEMFALAHFACAAAYIVHGDNSSHCWNNFFQHVINLQDLIGSESDARLFVQLFNLLFWPQCSSTETIDSHTPQYARKPTPETFLHSLKSNAVFQECSRFLDGKLSLNICSTSHDISV